MKRLGYLFVGVSLLTLGCVDQGYLQSLVSKREVESVVIEVAQEIRKLKLEIEQLKRKVNRLQK